MELYEAIYKRRDIRHFKSDPVPAEILRKILHAAHHAGSVGFMQPWNFIVIQDPAIRKQVKTIFEQQNALAEQNYSGSRRKLYKSLKLEGILESPLNLCVTCDRSRKGPHVLGQNSILDVDIYSTCCAVQNLWLAARAEGIGVGWVSIIDHQAVKEILDIPDHVLPVAYLCLGYPQEFKHQPMLEEVGWETRLNFEDLIFQNRWGEKLEANGKKKLKKKNICVPDGPPALAVRPRQKPRFGC
jgi:5,6-dimethylbenzimidazole synthase